MIIFQNSCFTNIFDPLTYVCNPVSFCSLPARFMILNFYTWIPQAQGMEASMRGVFEVAKKYDKLHSFLFLHIFLKFAT